MCDQHTNNDIRCKYIFKLIFNSCSIQKIVYIGIKDGFLKCNVVALTLFDSAEHVIHADNTQLERTLPPVASKPDYWMSSNVPRQDKTEMYIIPVCKRVRWSMTKKYIPVEIPEESPWGQWMNTITRSTQSRTPLAHCESTGSRYISWSRYN
jgi:hypothetical protein